MPVKCDYDKAGFQEYLRSQDDVIARWQALKCGLTPKAIDYRLRSGGQWQRILPGVYLSQTGSISLDQRQIAALLYAGEGSVMTGAMAVRRHQVECPGLNTIDVLIPAKEHRQSVDFVRITRTRKMPAEPYKAGAITFAPPARAVADAARLMARLDDVRAVVSSALQRNQCSFNDLVEELKLGPSAGSRYLAMALAEVGDGARSNAEISLHKLVDSSDLEKPVYNASLYTEDGIFIAKVDAWWQRAGVAGEVDSRQYHFKAADYDATQKRHNRLERYGINVQHWLPSTIREEPRMVLANLRGALAAGHKRAPLPLITKIGDAEVPLPKETAGNRTAFAGRRRLPEPV